ncbi:MAG: hypothetical protein R2688_09820 [Fimbriimonadaceae bacterium]
MSNFPVGVILMWHAEDGAIPNGWYICDGANGTPDLRNRFMRGCGGFGDVGRQGGSESQQINQDGRFGSDYNFGNTPWAGGPNPAQGGQAISTLPPFYDVMFIMFKGV